MRKLFASNGLRALVHLGAWLPLALIIADYARDALTANPIQAILTRTGKVSLVLLVLSFACTPLHTLLGWHAVLRVRRALGLYGFGYALLHVATFVVLDYGLDLALIAQVVVEKYYIIAGVAAFGLLLPLALTSTRGWQRRLKQRWRVVHRLVYLAMPLAVLHFMLLVKSLLGHPEPLVWAGVVSLLLALRIPIVRQRASQLQHWLRRALRRAAALEPGSVFRS